MDHRSEVREFLSTRGGRITPDQAPAPTHASADEYAGRLPAAGEKESSR
jgi:hypothetical protein